MNVLTRTAALGIAVVAALGGITVVEQAVPESVRVSADAATGARGICGARPGQRVFSPGMAAWLTKVRQSGATAIFTIDPIYIPGTQRWNGAKRCW